ncbi:hypothetical protein AMAG_14679 [Allomyces macrogynus ATCC 38327]|uniref:SH3 domain-containing protein n=1 Tax=Allomyces macrogynus (strain ATCC 38327) TaxID=578462 RepID=A0A0L0T738_ALLM3|nr:hypothetical protein AMAG_14679 [Allomyces macrogynus ATCC 38327]|eukprot:KNE70557.1 hypothetical protein AMAG_14679 [Allomyces macrogynus ATCC 38327]
MKRVRALYPFTAATDDQLSFARGQEFFVLHRKQDWYFATTNASAPFARNARVGLVPANYFEVVDDDAAREYSDTPRPTPRGTTRQLQPVLEVENRPHGSASDEYEFQSRTSPPRSTTPTRQRSSEATPPRQQRSEHNAPPPRRVSSMRSIRPSYNGESDRSERRATSRDRQRSAGAVERLAGGQRRPSTDAAMRVDRRPSDEGYESSQPRYRRETSPAASTRPQRRASPSPVVRTRYAQRPSPSPVDDEPPRVTYASLSRTRSFDRRSGASTPRVGARTLPAAAAGATLSRPGTPGTLTRPATPGTLTRPITPGATIARPTTPGATIARPTTPGARSATLGRRGSDDLAAGVAALTVHDTVPRHATLTRGVPGSMLDPTETYTSLRRRQHADALAYDSRTSGPATTGPVDSGSSASYPVPQIALKSGRRTGPAQYEYTLVVTLASGATKTVQRMDAEFYALTESWADKLPASSVPTLPPRLTVGAENNYKQCMVLPAVTAQREREFAAFCARLVGVQGLLGGTDLVLEFLGLPVSSIGRGSSGNRGDDAGRRGYFTSALDVIPASRVAIGGRGYSSAVRLA